VVRLVESPDNVLVIPDTPLEIEVRLDWTLAIVLANALRELWMLLSWAV
jgi:hypothetical protein